MRRAVPLHILRSLYVALSLYTATWNRAVPLHDEAKSRVPLQQPFMDLSSKALSAAEKDEPMLCHARPQQSLVVVTVISLVMFR